MNINDRAVFLMTTQDQLAVALSFPAYAGDYVVLMFSETLKYWGCEHFSPADLTILRPTNLHTVVILTKDWVSYFVFSNIWRLPKEIWFINLA